MKLQATEVPSRLTEARKAVAAPAQTRSSHHDERAPRFRSRGWANHMLTVGDSNVNLALLVASLLPPGVVSSPRRVRSIPLGETAVIDVMS